MDEKIYVAKLGRTVGLKGQMKIYIESDFPEQFKKGVKLFTNKNQALEIETINFNNSTVKFVGINDIDIAKKYTNNTLFTTYEQSKAKCKLGKNQFFWYDIKGCKVYENNICLGVVIDINRFPSDDYLTIKTDEKLLKYNKKTAKDFLIPYNKNFIISVDIEKKVIGVKNSLDILEAS